MDPHTYPGRPWPLSTFTIRYTDLYLRKSFQLLRDRLDPDTIIFLGDLFDGGREWATRQGDSADTEWKNYRDDFWMSEYGRFGSIFFSPWVRHKSSKSHGQRGQKMIATLPGNHDLGLGTGIKLPVRKRFNAYFGEGNRIDVVGNHTFVSLDTVSLSAKGQPDPATGNQIGDDGNELTREIWGPAEEFLSNVKNEKARAIGRLLRLQAGKPENEELSHAILEIEDPRVREVINKSNQYASTDIPSILLTHVPLYRASGAPCGPLRERFPPSGNHKNSEVLEKDDRNAIRVEAGTQYQNVLTPAVSNELVEKIGDVEHVFSGDDHDYCELVHRGYTAKSGGIREITVKSMSWAMGVRKPGFLLLSLWNPIDAQGIRVGDTKKGKSLESHLCLLPDQLSIFIQYGLLLGITVTVLAIRALRDAFNGSGDSKKADAHLLPLSKSETFATKQETMSASARSWIAPESKSTVSISPESQYRNGLAVRHAAGGTRSVSPLNGYGLPAEEANSLDFEDKYDVFRDGSTRDRRRWTDVELDHRSKQKRGVVSSILQDLKRGLFQVASVVLLWYAWLLWNR